MKGERQLQNLDSIMEDIKQLPNANEILSFREEVRYLVNVLEEYEAIVQATTGEIEGCKGLLITTDEQFLFVCHNGYQTMVFNSPYEEMEYVHARQTGYSLVMDLFFSGNKLTVNNIPLSNGVAIGNEIKEQIEFFHGSGQTTAEKKKKGSFFRVLLFLAIAIGAGYYVGPTFNTVEVPDYELHDGITQGEAEKEYGLVFSDMKLEPDSLGGGYAKGTLTNKSENVYDNVYVDVQYYNKKGDIVASEIEYVYDLNPGQSWKFEFPYYEDYIKTVKIVGIQAKIDVQ